MAITDRDAIRGGCGGFGELVGKVLDLVRHLPEGEAVPQEILDEARAPEAFAALDRLCAELGWSRRQMMGMLLTFESPAGVPIGPQSPRGRVDHHLTRWEVAAFEDEGYPPEALTRDLVEHLVEICPQCAASWYAEGDPRNDEAETMASVRRDLSAPRSSRAAGVALDFVDAWLASEAEERRRRLDALEPAECTRHLVGAFLHASWQASDGEEARARANAARRVYEVGSGAEGREWPRQTANLYVEWLVAVARAARLSGDLCEAGERLALARVYVTVQGCQDMVVVCELDRESAHALWARLDHRTAGMLLYRCTFAYLLLGEYERGVECCLDRIEILLDADEVRLAAEVLQEAREMVDGYTWRLALLEARVQVGLGRADEAWATLAIDGPGRAGILALQEDGLFAEVSLQRGLVELRRGQRSQALSSLEGAFRVAVRGGDLLQAARCAVGRAEAAVSEQDLAAACGWLDLAQQLEALPDRAGTALGLLADRIRAGSPSSPAFQAVRRYLERLGRNPVLDWQAVG